MCAKKGRGWASSGLQPWLSPLVSSISSAHCGRILTSGTLPSSLMRQPSLSWRGCSIMPLSNVPGVNILLKKKKKKNCYSGRC